MTRHLLRLIWNRKRHNLLLSIEIFFSFVVVLIITTMIVNVVANWRQPLGYSIDGLWRLNIQRPDANDAAAKPLAASTLKNVLAALRALPGIEAAAGMAIPPYSSDDWGRVGGNPRVFMGANAATDGLAEHRYHRRTLVLLRRRWRDGASRRHQPEPGAAAVR